MSLMDDNAVFDRYRKLRNFRVADNGGLVRKADSGTCYRLHHRSSNLVGRSKSVMSQMCILTR